MDFVALAAREDNMGSSTIHTKQGGAAIPFFSEPSATQKPELAEDPLSFRYGPFLPAAAEITGQV